MQPSWSGTVSIAEDPLFVSCYPGGRTTGACHRTWLVILTSLRLLLCPGGHEKPLTQRTIYRLNPMIGYRISIRYDCLHQPGWALSGTFCLYVQQEG